MVGAIVLQIVLIFLNAVFASAEIAVISTNETKLHKMAEKGDRRAKRLTRLTSQPSKFLSTIQVAITLAGLLGSAFAADNFAQPLAEALYNPRIPLSQEALKTICMILITFVLSYFNIVFGELIPKRIAMRRAEKMALGMSGMLRFVSILFAPLVWLLTVSVNGILRLFGIKPDEDDEQVTEEEILLMAEAGSEKGSIEASENAFIRNVFEFKETTAGEECTHRKDADLLFMNENDEQWKERIRSGRHSYFPVCGKDADDVIGVLNTKIYFRLDDKSRKNVMRHAVKSAMFVAESMPADALFRKMRTSREYFAVVVDEYGGMSGIITIHDLVELLVGELTEKGEESEYTIENTGKDTWEISGPAPLDEVESALGVELKGDAAEDCETFGGYVIAVSGDVPDDGTMARVETDQLIIDVLSVKDHCIEKMRVFVKRPPAEEKE